MSTKASSSTTATAPSKTTPSGGAKIKKELPSDEIKDFAQTAMNELLGWYGYDGVDRLDLTTKSSRLLHSGLTSPHNQMEKRRSRSRSNRLHMQINDICNNNNSNNNNNNNNNNINITNNPHSNNSRNRFRGTTLRCGGDSTSSDHDTQSSREDSKSPNAAEQMDGDEKIDYNTCCWCHRPIPDNSPDFLTTADGPRYCSETCFTQSRRASFKKAKTCDWCRHVRHAVSYVDFQDGASQLQFCSDKCLNQYKMQIFCKETQAQLDMNPHLREKGLEAAGSSAGLITPDLWLRNCRSRSVSPASTLSVSPTPPPPVSTAIHSSSTSSMAMTSPSVYKPIISVAPVAKLMSKTLGIMKNNQSSKPSRKKRPLRNCGVVGGAATGGGNNNSVNNNQPSNNVGSSPKLGAHKPKAMMSVATNHLQATSPAGRLTGCTPKVNLSQFANVQDIHMNLPQMSPIDRVGSQQQQQQPLPHPALRPANILPSFFNGPLNVQPLQQQHHHPQHQQHQALYSNFPPRQEFIQNPQSTPQFRLGHPHVPQKPEAMSPDVTGLSSLLGNPPLVTVMVPYPIIIPLVIPIPVPLPIIDFYKASLLDRTTPKPSSSQTTKGEAGLSAELSSPTLPTTTSNIIKTASSPTPQVKTNEQIESDKPSSAPCDKQQSPDEPLDFTKSKETIVSQVPFKIRCVEPVEAKAVSPLKASGRFIEQPATETTNEEVEALLLATSSSLINSSKPSNSNKTTTAYLDDKPDFSQGAYHRDASIDDRPNEEEANENLSAKQKLPKFKITRLHTKRLINTKESPPPTISECSRPLRKRKRIIDCDFQKMPSTAKGNEDQQADGAVSDSCNNPKLRK